MKQPIINTAGLCGFCFAVVLTPTAVRADVIFDNVEVTEDVNIGSFSFTSTTGGYQYQVADDFVLPGDGQWIVDGARWGGVLATRSEFPHTIGETFDFDLLILPDNGGRPAATPQDILPGTAVAHRQARATGTDTGIFEFAADFEASFDPITLDGGTPYWLVVAPRDDFTFMESNESGLGWLWGGISGAGNAWQGGADFKDDWFQQDRHQDFSLFGNAVPEPSTLLLFMSVFPVLHPRCRRLLAAPADYRPIRTHIVTEIAEVGVRCKTLQQ